jgi:lactoylglutathione lyase
MKALCLAALVCLAASALPAASTPANALLVLEKAQNTLVIVDPASLTIVARVPVGNDPHEVAVSDDGKIAYISNYSGGNTISRVDLVAQKPLPPIDLGALREPHGLDFAGGKLYFTAEGAKVVGRYDPATQKIDWVMGTGQNRTHMVTVSKDLQTVFTANVSSATVSVIAQGAPGPGRGPGGPGGPGRRGPPPGGPGGPGGPGRGGPPGDGVPDWIVTNIPVGHGSEGFDLSPDGKELWVANAQDSTISNVDVASRKVVQTIPSTQSANRLKITPDGKYVFVSDLGGNDLLVIDAATRKEFKRIPLPSTSEGLLMAPDGRVVYTTLNARDAVAVIDLRSMTMTGEVKTGRGPDGLAWAARREAPPALAAGDPARPHITGVAHMAIFVHDMAKSRAFYHDFLGYDEPYRLNNPDGALSMTFFKVNDRQYIEVFPERAPATDRLSHISFETDDIEGLRRYLAAKGVKVPAKAAVGRIQNQSFNTTDPDGHTVEMVQYMPDGWSLREKGKYMPDRVSDRIMHVGILVGSLEPALQFYGGILGFPEIWRGSRDGKILDWVNMKVPDGDTYVEFMLYDQLPAPTARGTAHHMCLEVPDLDKAKAWLDARPARKQYTRALEIHTGINRKRQLNLYDPDGTRLELMEPHTVDGTPAPSSTAPPRR